MQELLNAIDQHDKSDLFKILLFIQLASKLKNEILLTQHSAHLPNQVPPFLSISIVHFLASSCSISKAEVENFWRALKDLIWSNPIVDDKYIASIFKDHGLDKGFPSTRSLWPPSQLCTNAECMRLHRGQKIQIAMQRQGILYTLDEGPLPIYFCFLTCKDCKTDYHIDFEVRNEKRLYYDNPPNVLQIADHQFVERRLIDTWRISSNTAWVSFGNCATIYLDTHQSAMHRNIPDSWPFQARLTGKHVADAFILVGLLEDFNRRNGVLEVPHGGLQSDRYKEAMQLRNERIELYGQQELRHFCHKCVRMYPATDDRPLTVSVHVMDGITLGRPTCGVPHCTIPLTNKRHRFCPSHTEFNEKCSIIGCEAKISSSDKRTCQDPLHQQIENVHHERGQAAFQLKERLKRAKVAHPKNGAALDLPVGQIIEQEDNLNEVYEVIGERVIPSEEESLTHTELARASLNPTFPATDYTTSDLAAPKLNSVVVPAISPRNKKIRAQFGRSRTHNEQIIVAPCGMIIARETFYYAESITAVVEMIKRTYRGGYMPNHIIFDNNCSVAKHVKGDPDFKNVGLAVDVFHFANKHAETDTFCQSHCNPAFFPELLGDDGKNWFFNTSIAEQTNVWLGGFHSICREMSADTYTFFLDEMIMMRNRSTKEKLKEYGASSWV